MPGKPRLGEGGSEEVYVVTGDRARDSWAEMVTFAKDQKEVIQSYEYLKENPSRQREEQGKRP